MKRLFVLITALTSCGGSASAMEELVVYVPPEEAQAVIERNELQFEEYRWYAFPNRIRVAKFNVSLLDGSPKTFQFTPFEDVAPIIIKGKSKDGARWKGEHVHGRIPNAELERISEGDPAMYDAYDRHFNRVELLVTPSVKDPQTGQYITAPSTDAVVGHNTNTRPIKINKVEIVTRVAGTIFYHPFDSADRHGYEIKPLYNDVEYSVIVESDVSKVTESIDSPDNSEAYARSEKGRREARLRKEKQAYMEKVAERIAAREKTKQ